MSYWTKRRRINAAVENQIAELFDDSSLSDVNANVNVNVDHGEPCVCVTVCDDAKISIACGTKSHDVDYLSHGDTAVDMIEFQSCPQQCRHATDSLRHH